MKLILRIFISSMCLPFLLGLLQSIDAQSVIRLKQWRVESGGNGHWYAIFASTHPWVVHRDTAHTFLIDTFPAYLATVISAEENRFIRDSIVSGVQTDNAACEYYFGGEIKYPLGLEWITGEPFSGYTNWQPGEPNGSGWPTPGRVVAMWGRAPGYPGTWNDVPKDTTGVGPAHQLWSLLEWNGGDTIVADTPLSPLISLKQWRRETGGNDHWYAVLTSRLPWITHRDTAATFLVDSQPAYLATITRASENKFVLDSVIHYLSTRDPSNRYYLGLAYDSGAWHWLSHEPYRYSNWAQYQPIFADSIPIGTLAGPWAHIPAGTWSDEARDTSWDGSVPRLWSILEWGPDDFSVDTAHEPPPFRNLRQWRTEAGGNGHWYAIFSSAQPWAVQRDTASTFRVDSWAGYLATATSPAENSFIEDSVAGGGTFYLGGYYSDWKFHWVTGEDFGFVNWREYEPNDVKRKDKVPVIALYGSDGGGDWIDLPADSTGANDPIQYMAVFEWGAPDVPTDSSLLLPIRNQKQWSSLAGGNDHWYGIIPKSMQWKSHYQIAPEYRRPLISSFASGSLATITSEAENNFIRDSIIAGVRTDNGMNVFFLGLKRDPFYSNWTWGSGERYWYEHWAGDSQPSVRVIDQCAGIAGDSTPYAPGDWLSISQTTLSSEPDNRLWSIVEFDGTCCHGTVGNVDGDSSEQVDIDDLVQLGAWVFRSTQTPICKSEADFNQDHVVDVADVAALVDALFLTFTDPPTCTY